MTAENTIFHTSNVIIPNMEEKVNFYDIYIILDILEEDTRKYWTRCDNIGRVQYCHIESPIFPCILRKQEIQYYYYYLDHPSEMMNSLSEQKILKIDDTGNKFSKILGKYYETSFIHNSSFRSP